MQDMAGLQTLPVTSTPTLGELSDAWLYPTPLYKPKYSPGQRIERGATTTTTLKHRRRRRTTNCGRDDEPEETEFDDVHYADDDGDTLSEEASRQEEDSSATLSTTGGSGGIGGDEADAEDDAISTSASTGMGEDALIPIDESGKYNCPICKTKLSSQHQLTLHFRSHNSQEDNSEKGFVCKICFKVLSSASSLDRHVLVHSGERPFKCRVCHLAFTTNGNMHRHMRTHTPRAQASAAASHNGYESSDSSCGEASASTVASNNNNISFNNNSHKYNNNLIGLGEKRRALDEALALNNADPDVEPPPRKSACRTVSCKFCPGLDFHTQDALQIHLSLEHADEVAGAGNTEGVSASGAAAAMRFKTHRHLENNQAFPHGTTGHIPSVASTAGRSIIGFKADTASGSESGSAAEFFAGLDLRDANSRSNKNLSPVPSMINSFARGSSVMVTPPDSREEEEEQEQEQDGFAQEFRRMKLSGEFPCRLCDAVYPNLRALKGHNRTHLSESLDNYQCNMCTFTSTDKAAVVRHMRSHNGDRPYECAVCGYAFTTKANCERHLRNRHGKASRDDVKASIIFHAEEAIGISGGPTPERISGGGSVTSSTDSDVKRTLRFESKQSDSDEAEDEVDDLNEDDESDVNSSAPLDLTVDVLDLSKKNKSRDSPPLPPPLPLNLHRPTEGGPPPPPNPAAAAAAILSMFPQYHPGSFINPYLLPHYLPGFVADFTAEMKERLNKDIRGLHLSGGNLVPSVIPAPPPSMPPQQPVHPAHPAIPVIKTPSPSLTSLPPTSPTIPIYTAQEMKKESKSESSVRMVIRNGVLMPKQKQRRYRTERPFSCEHCSARFTLRSNMERHVKQQHPDFWQQKQKGAAISGMNSGSSRGRGTNGGFLQVLPNENLPQLSPTSHSQGNQTTEEGRISEHVKAAIKAKMHNADEEDEISKLVIDETGHSDEVEESKPDLASVSSLLDNASTQTQTFRRYFARSDADAHQDGSIDMKRERMEDNLDDTASITAPVGSEDEEGLVAPNSDQSGSEERSESDGTPSSNRGIQLKKRSAYSLAPNRVSCPYCHRKFPWTSSLRRHILTHTGQKPYKCAYCTLLFTTKSNCDRHLARKHQDLISSGSHQQTSHPSIPSSPPGHGSASSSSPPSPGALATGDFSTIRHVPERPYKCQACPSSTFSTQSNLRKHLETKHGNGNMDDHDDEEILSKESPVGLNLTTPPSHMTPVLPPTPPTPPTPASTMTTSSGGSSSSDNPFKCHLCEASYAERNEAIEHIRVNHPTEYQLLLNKGALEASQASENDPHHSNHGSGAHDEHNEESIEQLRGKFPDYANRKVKCAFCLRRFWSAEDLRRHMRTHTGERPFSCDICRRRFTLKHSMLRHRKKHPNCSIISPASIPSVISMAPIGNGSLSNRDEASSPSSIVPILPPSAPITPPSANNNNNNASMADAMLESFGSLGCGISGASGGSDLIGNLLGIQDSTLIEKMLQTKSAADAAKLLGVQSRD